MYTIKSQRVSVFIDLIVLQPTMYVTIIEIGILKME